MLSIFETIFDGGEGHGGYSGNHGFFCAGTDAFCSSSCHLADRSRESETPFPCSPGYSAGYSGSLHSGVKSTASMPNAAAERKIAPTLVGFITRSNTATRRAPAQTCSAFGSSPALHGAQHPPGQVKARHLGQNRLLCRENRTSGTAPAGAWPDFPHGGAPLKTRWAHSRTAAPGQ